MSEEDNVKDNVKWLERTIKGIQKYIAILFIIILIYPLICIGIFLAVGNQISVEDKYDIFKDILILILTIAGVSLAAIGYIIYQYILEDVSSQVKITMKEYRDDIKNRLETLENKGEFFSNALVSLNIGFTYWLTYKG